MRLMRKFEASIVSLANLLISLQKQVRAVWNDFAGSHCAVGGECGWSSQRCPFVAALPYPSIRRVGVTTSW